MTKLTKKKLLVAIIICAVLVGGSVIWFTRQVAEAAVLDPHPGLVGWWRFDEGSGTAAEDSSGNENDGTINGAGWVAGKYGQALSFNGVGNFVLVQNSDSLNFGTSTDFSITFWFNPTAIDWHVILNKKDTSSGETAGYQIATHNNVLYAFIGDGTQVVVVVSASVSVAVWQYCALTVQRNASAQWYVSGNPSGNPVSVTTVGNMDNTLNLYIGGSDSCFSGLLDEINIYNRVVSPSEIQENFLNPNFSSRLLAKIPKDTYQIITTISWQGTGNISATLVSPSQNYTEAEIPVYQKTTYSTASGMASMLNIKRLSVTISALPSDQNWYIVLTFESANAYQLTVEVQK